MLNVSTGSKNTNYIIIYYYVIRFLMKHFGEIMRNGKYRRIIDKSIAARMISIGQGEAELLISFLIASICHWFLYIFHSSLSKSSLMTHFSARVIWERKAGRKCSYEQSIRLWTLYETDFIDFITGEREERKLRNVSHRMGRYVSVCERHTTNVFPSLEEIRSM